MKLEDENIQDIAPFGVRMPSALKAKIKAAAKQNRHSMNAEIVERLETSFLDKVSSRDEVLRAVEVLENMLKDVKLSA